MKHFNQSATRIQAKFRENFTGKSLQRDKSQFAVIVIFSRISGAVIIQLLFILEIRAAPNTVKVGRPQIFRQLGKGALEIHFVLFGLFKLLQRGFLKKKNGRKNERSLSSASRKNVRDASSASRKNARDFSECLAQRMPRLYYQALRERMRGHYQALIFINTFAFLREALEKNPSFSREAL